MRKSVAILAALVVSLTALCGCGQYKPASFDAATPASDVVLTVKTSEKDMTPIEKEYYAFINALESFPIRFTYGTHAHKGFSRRFFTELTRKSVADTKKIATTIWLQRDENMLVQIESNLYPDYDAYDYTVYFVNISSTENTLKIGRVQALDMTVEGNEPRLKGIMGDYVHQFSEYDHDLTEQTVRFTNLRGRATHEYFPYFNLETEHGGAFLALGWGGTWEAEFVYDADSGTTHATGTGTVGMDTFLRPKETVRTPLIGVVRYYERDEDAAMNKWRSWMVDCVYPRNYADTDEVVQPFSTTYHCFDNDNPNRFHTDGSTAESYVDWQKSVDAMYDEGLYYDVQWVDAGWYADPYGNTVERDWWGTVGTWQLDPVKWPEGTFERRVEYAHDNGQLFLVWFEPERVTHLDGMVKNHGYKREWVLSDHGNNNTFINNLGDPDCLTWTLTRIIDFMEKYDIDLYREDFNIDPGIFWTIGDGYEGKDRKGITENKYMQGHYALWDGILRWAADHGKPTWLDSCASGGGRNDLETMRRAIPINRSDADRFTTTLRLSLTPRLSQWLPFNGAVAKDATSLASNTCDLYALRASYLCVYEPAANFYLDKDKVDWSVYRKGLEEWNEIKQYLLNDFYALTPDHAPTDDTQWTVFEYFDAERDSGVVQAFRQTLCEEATYTVALKGVDPNRYYTVRDIDGNNSVARVKGSMLRSGLRLRADEARTAIILYIEPAE